MIILRFGLVYLSVGDLVKAESRDNHGHKRLTYLNYRSWTSWQFRERLFTSRVERADNKCGTWELVSSTLLTRL